LFVATLEVGALSQLSGTVAFVVLAGFGQYAAYRARRYRLTRTVWRGLRFHQIGSAMRYALRAMTWWGIVAVTFGLAYPWATANLERYKMRNTYYGDLGGRFAGAGWRLFGRGILMWALVIGPLLVGLTGAMTLIDWPAIGRALSHGTLTSILVAIQGDDRMKQGFAVVGISLTWSIFFAILLYPAFQAVVMRWWLAGLRLGDAAAASDLRMRRFYGAYLRYILYVILFTIVFAIGAGIVAGLGYATLSGLIDFEARSVVRDGAVGAAVIAAYVIFILACSTIYQVVIKYRLWQVAVDSVLVTGLAALDHVHASDATSSAVGEGLADALGSGGI
jgi:uncharacterized membrane protein YjgN (DUF898 family)